MRFRVKAFGASLRIALISAFALFTVGSLCAQELYPDSNRVFVTELKWQHVDGAPRSGKLKAANGTLVILYLEGVYAEVTGTFTRSGKEPATLDLKKPHTIQLGKWNRVEDEDAIRIDSQEVTNDRPFGPVTPRTCGLEHPSSTHIADTIVCEKLVVFHEQKPIVLGDFPSIVRQLVATEKKESAATAQ